jgi:hypothetical protein
MGSGHTLNVVLADNPAFSTACKYSNPFFLFMLFHRGPQRLTRPWFTSFQQPVRATPFFVAV